MPWRRHKEPVCVEWTLILFWLGYSLVGVLGIAWALK